MRKYQLERVLGANDYTTTTTDHWSQEGKDNDKMWPQWPLIFFTIMKELDLLISHNIWVLIQYLSITREKVDID